MTAAFEYPGTELHLFRDAHRWKSYLRAQLAPYIRGDVLEVGAGIGGTTAVLHTRACDSWTCLEPDPRLAETLARSAVGRRPGVSVVARTLADLDRNWLYDSVLYVDVLEHIGDDHAELDLAAAHIRPGGHVLVVSPAHNWLYSAFDRAVGHHRRYDRRSLRQLTPAGMQLVRLHYLDSAGIIASLGNRLFTRAREPSPSQIAIWDRFMVPVSRIVDPYLGFHCGKTVFAAWLRPRT